MITGCPGMRSEKGRFINIIIIGSSVNINEYKSYKIWSIREVLINIYLIFLIEFGNNSMINL